MTPIADPLARVATSGQRREVARKTAGKAPDAIPDEIALQPETKAMPAAAIAMLIRRANQLCRASIRPALSFHGINDAQWLALSLLHDGNVNNAADLARALGHDPGAMTRLLDALELRRLVHRQRAAGDRRTVAIKVSGEGRDLVARCRGMATVIWAEALRDWNSDDLSAVTSMLTQLNESLTNGLTSSASADTEAASNQRPGVSRPRDASVRH